MRACKIHIKVHINMVDGGIELYTLFYLLARHFRLINVTAYVVDNSTITTPETTFILPLPLRNQYLNRVYQLWLLSVKN